MSVEHRVDPTSLNAVVGALTRSGSAAREASNELLAHYSDTGDAPTQRAVDTLIDHAADALRALTDSIADTSRELEATAMRTTTFQAQGCGVARPTSPLPGPEEGETPADDRDLHSR